MMHKRPLPWIAGAAVLLASGTLLAAAQTDQRQAGQSQVAIQPGTAAQSVAVSKPTDANALPRPQNRVAIPLTIAECEGLGGKVVDTDQKACPWTGKICYTADKNGVIRKACITMAPS
jgi:hypothetical protein